MNEPKAADYDWMAEARMEAGSSWDDAGLHYSETDSRLAAAFARKLARWMVDASRHARNEQFWRERCETLDGKVRDLERVDEPAANPVDHPKPLVFHSMEGWKTMGKEESPPPPGLSRREQVWLSAWCARAGSTACAGRYEAECWADDCLTSFDARIWSTGGDR